MIDPVLEAAYRATDYCVDVPGEGRVVLRIGVPSAPFDSALKAAGWQSWAILAAVNPWSQPCTEAENAARHQALLAAVAISGWSTWPGVNLAADGNWPPEPALCLLDIPLSEALRLAEGFQQNAFVAPDGHGLPSLVWVGRA
ncbi:MAG: DUF3293 domain-containing protein [Rhodocyclaceae bacterium]